MTVYFPNENRTIAELQQWDARQPAQAPFVRIGRLLLAVDQTGAEAWQPLMNTLRTPAQNRFMLYSGRHGALEGCFHDNGQAPIAAADRGFYDDDQREAVRFSAAARVDIEVVDTSRLPKPLYKQRILTDVANGYWVIVAWCHSIASMCTIPDNVTRNYSRGSYLWISAQNMTRRRISDIVTEDYGWVHPR